jgi:hypothetical protein
MPDLTAITLITLKMLKYGLLTGVGEGKTGGKYEGKL